jgi:predicted nicotinamide N-methyase
LGLDRQACIALSNHFIADPSTIQEARNIVELGAGVGLLSLVAATLREEAENGAGKIVTTDVEENVLELLGANVRLSERIFLFTSPCHPSMVYPP